MRKLNIMHWVLRSIFLMFIITLSCEQKETIHNVQLELPTQAGKNELVRYPFLQTAQSTSMKISWATRTQGDASALIKNTNGKVLNTWIAKQTYNSYLNIYQFTTEVVGLKENESYLYDIVKGDVTLAKNIPLKTLSGNSNFGFVVIGDTGLDSETIISMRDQIMSRDTTGKLMNPFDFSIGVGDLAYRSGADSEFDVTFFRQFSGRSDSKPQNSMISSRPFFPVLGNHEYRTKNAAGFRRAFDVPPPSDCQGYKSDPTDHGRFYSFDNGNAHFVIVDTEAWGENQVRSEEMLAWVKNDLETKKKQWNFVFYHRSPVSFGPHGYNTGQDWGEMDGNRAIRSKLMTICQDNDVNIAFYGHDHMYQRSVPLKINNDKDGSIVRNEDLSINSTDGIIYVGTGWGKPTDEETLRTPITKAGSQTWQHQREVTGIGFDWLAQYDHDGNGVLEENEYAMVDGDAIYNPWLSSRRGYMYIEINGSQLIGYAFTTQGEIADKWTIQLTQ